MYCLKLCFHVFKKKISPLCLQDGIIRLLDVSREKIILKEEIDVNFPVTSIAFSPNYQILAWGSPEVKHFN